MIKTWKKTLGNRSFFGFLKILSAYSTEASFETKPYKLHRLESDPSTCVSVTKEDALKYYRQMYAIRRLEDATSSLYREKIIRGFCHLYTGQEACAVGMRAAMRDQDSAITAYRCHGWAYLMGVSIHGVLSELTGRMTGCARGKGGSMHMFSKNFYGGNGIVGAQVPLGVGISFAHKYMEEDRVCVALYGDGAANQGQLFEVYNIAKLWKTPTIFVCENNGYGMGTSAARSSANTDYYTRGDYVPGIWVDGMDVLAVREATRFAIDHALSEKGPILLETHTYRFTGHSMSDPGTTYRTRDEVQEVRQKRDPINSFREKITSSGLATLEEFKKIEGEVRCEVDEAFIKSKLDNEVPMEELTMDVYSNAENFGSIRGRTPLSELPHVTKRKTVKL